MTFANKFRLWGSIVAALVITVIYFVFFAGHQDSDDDEGEPTEQVE